MRKMRVSARAKSGGKKALAAALALTMAVPSALSMMGAVTPDLEAQAADNLPDPIMTVDMSGGFQQEKKSVADGGSEMAVLTTPDEFVGDGVVNKDNQLQVLKFAENTGGNTLYEYTDANGNKSYIPFIEDATYKKGVTGNQPTSYYDQAKGSTVLMLDSHLKIDKFVKNHLSTEDGDAQTCSPADMEQVDKDFPVYTGGYHYEIDKNGYRTQVADDKETEAKATLQEEVTAESAVTIKNPFATDEARAALAKALDPAQFPEKVTTSDNKVEQYDWRGVGVTISFWAKLPKDARTDEEKETGEDYDSTLLVFQNMETDPIYDVDDYEVYDAVQGYIATHDHTDDDDPSNDTPNDKSYTCANGYATYTAADYNIPQYQELTDGRTRKTYKVIMGSKDESGKFVYGPGKLMFANPQVKALMPADPNADATEKVYYQQENAAGADVTINTRNAETGAAEVVYAKAIGGYLAEGYETLPNEDFSNGSKIRTGKIQGSMQIQASGAFSFKEDNYAEEDTLKWQEDGVTPRTAADGSQEHGNKAIKGSKQLNPNGTQYYDPANPNIDLEHVQFRHYNMLHFEQNQDIMPSPLTSEEEGGQGEWHYMTVVIMNDKVDIYEDDQVVTEDDRTVDNVTFGSSTAAKYFNYGTGYRGYGDGADYSLINSSISWPVHGQKGETGGPANCYGRSMLEWLTDDDTYLQIGGQGVAVDMTGQKEIHTVDGTCIDDIKFYTVPFTEEQALAAYEQAKDDMAAEKAAKETLKTYDFNAEALNALPEGMSLASTNDASAEVKPGVVNDGVRGHVLRLPTSKSSKSSAVQFANPFAGMTGLENASVSFWVRGLANDKGKLLDGVVASFVDEPKKLEHEKIQTTKKDTESRTQLYLTMNTDAYFMAACNTNVSEDLKNHYQFSTKRNWGTYSTKPSASGYNKDADDAQKAWDAQLATMNSWHYVTMTMNNGGMSVFLDGVALPNNLTNGVGKFGGYGPRFLDGYYGRINDGMAQYKLGSNNQGATTLMSFLTQSDTSAYLGFAFQAGQKVFETNNSEILVDDLTYATGNVTADEAKALYDTAVEAAKNEGPVDGEEIYAGTTGNNEGPDDSDNPVTDDKQTSDVQTNADGSMTATANGVTVNIPAGALPDNAKFVVTVMGTQASAATYAEADSVLNTISGLSIGKRVLYDIHFEDASGNTLTPTAPVAISLTPISGYTASNCSIVSIGEKKLLQATVSGGSLNFSSQAMGIFAVVEAKAGEKPAGTTGGATVTNAPKSSDSGSSKAGQTGDVADVVIPILLLGAAVAVVVYIRRKQLISQ